MKPPSPFSVLWLSTPPVLFEPLNAMIFLFYAVWLKVCNRSWPTINSIQSCRLHPYESTKTYECSPLTPWSRRLHPYTPALGNLPPLDSIRCRPAPPPKSGHGVPPSLMSDTSIHLPFPPMKCDSTSGCGCSQGNDADFSFHESMVGASSAFPPSPHPMQNASGGPTIPFPGAVHWMLIFVSQSESQLFLLLHRPVFEGGPLFPCVFLTFPQISV
jgi:hypothetical protein